MLNQDIDALTERLASIRLERAKAIERLEKVNEAEIETLKSLEEAKTKAGTSKRGVCSFVEGDIVRITNRLRNEYGTVGMVRTIRNRQVTIRNSGTGIDYHRAWFNLELVEPASARQRKKTLRR